MVPQSRSSLWKNPLAECFGLREDIQEVYQWITSHKNVLAATLVEHDQANHARVVFIKTVSTAVDAEAFLADLRQDLRTRMRSCSMPDIWCLVDHLPSNIDQISQALAHPIAILTTQSINNEFYIKELKAGPRFHDLPTNKPRQAGLRTFESFINRTLGAKVTESIDGFCSNHRLSRAGVLFCLFTIVLTRYSRHQALALSIKTARYPMEDEQGNNTQGSLLFRYLYDDNINFIDYVFAQTARLRLFLQHNPLDIAEVQASLMGHGNVDWHPLSLLTFNFIDASPGNQIALTTPEEVVRSEAFIHDLELVVLNHTTEISLGWRYNANTFDVKMIDRMADSYSLLLEQVIADVETPVSRLRIVEQSQPYTTSSTPERDLAAENLYTLFEASARTFPHQLALIHENHKVTYANLRKRAEEFAVYLESHGIKQDQRCAVYMDRSPGLIVCILAIIKVGALYVPLDPDFPKQHADFVMRDSAAQYIISESKFIDQLSPYVICKIYIDEVPLIATTAESIELESASNRVPAGRKTIETARNAAPAGGFIFYTSGSSGSPKGVLLEPHSVLNRLIWMKQNFPAAGDARYAVKTSIAFVDHLAEVLQPLISGAAAILLGAEPLASMNELRMAIDLHGITHITLLPSQLRGLLESPAGSLISLNTVISSGEVLHQDISLMFHNRFGGAARLMNLYGSTETGADATYKEICYEESAMVLRYFSDADLADNHTQSTSEHEMDLSRISLLAISNHGSQTYTSPNVGVQDIIQYFKDSNMPQRPVSLTQYINEINTHLLPFLVDVSSRRFIGHMTSGIPNFIPEFSRLISKLNQNLVKIETSKGLTFLERQVLAMIHREFYQKSDEFYQAHMQDSAFIFGIVTSGGSLANITALHCARNRGLLHAGVSMDDLRLLGPHLAMQKLGFKKQVILVSRLAHYSLRKAASLLGIGESGLLIIDQDENQKINTDAARQKIIECKNEGTFVIAIVGMAGATETGTIDPLQELAAISAEFDIHFHVDAAWGGAFIFCDKYKYKLRGIELADSITFCAHKQLYLAQGVSVCLFKDARSLFAISTNANYQAKQGSFDFGQFTLEGSRPATSLMLHAAFHLLAKEGYAWIIDNSMEKTSYFRRIISDSECFQLIGDSDLNIVNYRYIPSSLRRADHSFTPEENHAINAITEKIQEEQFFRGKTFVSKTRILYAGYPGCQISVFRVVLANVNTTLRDLFDVLRDQLDIANEIVEPATRQNPLLDAKLSDHFDYRIRAAVSIGKPIWNARVYVLDRYLNLLPPGVIGEMYVAGYCLAKTYIGHAEKLEDRFIHNPFDSDPRYSVLYKTGDLARIMENGDIEYLGREDRQVKVAGFRVELQEIEIKLCECRGVKAAVVEVAQDIQQGEILTAYVSGNQMGMNREAFCRRVQEELAKKLPYYMVPTSIQYLEKLALVPSGKIRYRKQDPVYPIDDAYA